MASWTSKNTKHMVELGLYTGIALTIFLLELQLPSPLPMIPGMKLGLANLVTLYLIAEQRAKDGILVLLARILIGSIFAGQMMTLWYALTGGIMSFLVMMAVRKLLRGKQLWFVSCMGGIFHNIGQTLIACLLMDSAVFSYLPFLIVFGLGTGVFNGFVVTFFIKALDRTPYGRKRR